MNPTSTGSSFFPVPFRPSAAVPGSSQPVPTTKNSPATRPIGLGFSLSATATGLLVHRTADDQQPDQELSAPIHSRDEARQRSDCVGCGSNCYLQRVTVNGVPALVKRTYRTPGGYQDMDGLVREARVLAALTSAHGDAPPKHVPHYLGSGVSPSGEPYLLVSDAGGQPLTTRIDRGEPTLPLVSMVIGLGLSLFEALQGLASHHVVHQDIKADNVLALDSGYMLIDFGSASGRQGLASEPTVVGAPPGFVPGGTPGVHAPEYGDRPDQVGPISDVWSVALLMVHQLIGPDDSLTVLRQAIDEHSADGYAAALLLVEHSLAAALGQWSAPPEAAMALTQLLMGLLVKDPDARHLSAPHAITVLAQCADALKKHLFENVYSPLQAEDISYVVSFSYDVLHALARQPDPSASPQAVAIAGFTNQLLAVPVPARQACVNTALRQLTNHPGELAVVACIEAHLAQQPVAGLDFSRAWSNCPWDPRHGGRDAFNACVSECPPHTPSATLMQAFLLKLQDAWQLLTTREVEQLAHIAALELARRQPPGTPLQACLDHVWQQVMKPWLPGSTLTANDRQQEVQPRTGPVDAFVNQWIDDQLARRPPGMMPATVALAVWEMRLMARQFDVGQPRGGSAEGWIAQMASCAKRIAPSAAPALHGTLKTLLSGTAATQPISVDPEPQQPPPQTLPMAPTAVREPALTLLETRLADAVERARDQPSEALYDELLRLRDDWQAELAKRPASSGQANRVLAQHATEALATLRRNGWATRPSSQEITPSAQARLEDPVSRAQQTLLGVLQVAKRSPTRLELDRLKSALGALAGAHRSAGIPADKLTIELENMAMELLRPNLASRRK